LHDIKVKPVKSNRSLLFWLFFAAVFAWAVFVRTWSVGDRAFWMDEAWVANLVTRLPFQQLLKHTEEPIPPFFAVPTKLTSYLWLSPEIALRLLPMICGIAVVPLVYLVVRTLRIPPVTSLAVTTLCASSPLLVIWSRELKQYQIEAFFSILLAYLVFKTRRPTTTITRRVLAVSIIVICLLGPWFGYGFIFPAVTLLGILILLKPLNSNRFITVLTGLIGFLVLAGSVMILLKTTATDQASNRVLRSFIGPWFIQPTSLHSWARAIGYGASTIVMMFLPFYQFFYLSKLATCLLALIFGFVTLLGLLFWPKASRAEMVCWTVIPWFLILAAAVAQQYPFGATRMMCFTATSFVPAFALGLFFLCRELTRPIFGSTKPGFVIASIAVLSPVFYIVQVPLNQKYWVKQDFKKVTNSLIRQRQPDEPVIVTVFANSPVRFYARHNDQGFTYAPYTVGTRPIPDFDYIDFAKNFLMNTGKKWWILTTNSGYDQPYKTLIREASIRGYRIELVDEGGDDTFGKALLLVAVKK
jgi:hypothetical protein